MTLLIEYLEDAAKYIHGRRSRLRQLEAQYRRFHDPDIKLEMNSVKNEISRKAAEVNDELLVNLDEFRHIKKYFPDLLEVLMEDDCIGRAISRKAWLLDFKPLQPKEAMARLAAARGKRKQLREAKKFLGKWAGRRIKEAELVSKYPVMKGRVKDGMELDEVLAVIKDLNHSLRHEGWLVLINDSLITGPLAKFMGDLSRLRYEEDKARSDHDEAKGKGTMLEATRQRQLERATRRRQHGERMLRHILLANPSFLHSMKKKDWLSKEKQAPLQRFAATVTPHTVKERAWLNAMKKKLGS